MDLQFQNFIRREGRQDWQRIVASDVDGTLLPYGDEALEERLFPVIRQLQASGALFVAASGREYHSLRQLFWPVHEEIFYISVNGSQIYFHDQLLYQASFEAELAKEIIAEIEATPAKYGVHLTVSGSEYMYIKPNQGQFREMMIADFGNKLREITDFTTITEPIVKISVYRPHLTTAALYDWYAPRWAQREGVELVISGINWLDFSCANKGASLKTLADIMEVPREEVYAFGDQYNDLKMLQYVGNPYIMSDSMPALREYGFKETASPIDTMQDLLAQWSGQNS